MTCPYCNSKDTTSVIYLYRYNDNNTFVKKNNDEVKYSERKRKPKRLNYDGTLITDHNHNKYCPLELPSFLVPWIAFQYFGQKCLLCNNHILP